MTKEKKKVSKLTDILRMFICAMALWGIFAVALLESTPDPLAEPEAKPVKVVKEKTKAEKIAAQFSTYDGRHFGTARRIKSRLHDPDSFKHLKTAYAVVGDKLQIFMSYYAKNAFGAQVLTTYAAIVDIETNVVLSLKRHNGGR